MGGRRRARESPGARYLRFASSHRDGEALLADRGVQVGYETVRQGVETFGVPLLVFAGAAISMALAAIMPTRPARPEDLASFR